MRTMKYKRKYKYDQLMKSWGQCNVKGKYKYDQLMKSWGQWNIKAVYKYDQLMKVMRTLKYTSSL